MTVEIDTVESYNTYDVSGEREARQVWRDLPTREAYPVDSRWVHPSRNVPVTILGYMGVGETRLLVKEDGATESEEWNRTALDTYGRPALPDMTPDVVTTDVETTPITRSEGVFSAGDRVRLIDAGGDTESHAVIGDTGTVQNNTYGAYALLEVHMDDGCNTSRDARRWEKVTEEEVSYVTTSDGPFSKGDRVRIVETGQSLRPEWHGMEVTYVGPSLDSQMNPHEVAFDIDAPNVASLTTASDGLRHGFVTRIEKVDSPDVEEFPLGYQFRDVYGHYGDTPPELFTVNDHNPENGQVRAEGETCGNTWFDRSAIRNATPYLGVTPAEVAEDVPASPVEETADVAPVEAETAPESPWRPAEGDRVVVTQDDDSPDNNGLSATVLEVRSCEYGGIRVQYDGYEDGKGSGGTYGWWVSKVRPEMPATPEEFRAAIDRAVEAAKLEMGAECETERRTAKQEGRKEAEELAAAAMERIVESAHDYATRNELCRQFDLFMVENGLRPRDLFTRDYQVTYSETINAHNEEEARTIALEALNTGDYYRGSFDVELAEE